MKQFDKKIKLALLISVIVLMTFISFSNAGILFSSNDKEVIVVSTQNRVFDPNNYSANVVKVTESATTTTTATTKIETTTTTKTTIPVTTTKSWDGPVLSKSKGTIIGPTGKETYYNLNMSGVVNSMRNAGFSEEEYPYYIREDGVKMLGKYVMVAANYSKYPKGSLVESSLGTAIVCDTGGFASANPDQLDIATNW